jgi:hypothetical protein
LNDIKIIYKEENGEISTNEIWDYIDKPGVWALFGKKEDKLECLNVGKCVDVGREILYDVSCLHNLEFYTDGNEQYINQFGEDCNFQTKRRWTQECLYPYISNLKYDSLVFVYVYDKSDMRKEIEFAWLTHARFWRNGRVFKSIQDNYYDNNKVSVLENRDTITTVKSLTDLVELLKKYNWT